MDYEVAFEEGCEAGFRGLDKVVPFEFISNYDNELHDEWLRGYEVGQIDRKNLEKSQKE